VKTQTDISHNSSEQVSANQLEISDICLSYSEKTVIQNLSLQLKRGQIGCLLGSSGCGKTTLLRSISGFEKVSSGEIKLADKSVSSNKFHTSPEKRQVGMVFQDFALFPHLSIRDNICFGLHQLHKQDQQSRVDEMLTMINLNQYAERFPHELSGGQQQRVALARAIAPQPDILLMDEPFSSLDSELREQIASDVRQLLKQNNITALLVTHDQNEAFAMADRVGVMHQGKLLQWDTPYDLYHQPKTPYVANFIGEGSIISLKTNSQNQLVTELGNIQSAKNLKPETRYDILIRPDDILYSADSHNKLEIIDKRFRGSDYFYQLKLSDGQKILCVTPSHIDFDIGEYLPVIQDLEHLVIFSRV
jgi:iron(III) transport system ATP-binding protein